MKTSETREKPELTSEREKAKESSFTIYLLLTRPLAP